MCTCSAAAGLPAASCASRSAGAPSSGCPVEAADSAAAAAFAADLKRCGGSSTGAASGGNERCAAAGFSSCISTRRALTSPSRSARSACRMTALQVKMLLTQISNGHAAWGCDGRQQRGKHAKNTPSNCTLCTVVGLMTCDSSRVRHQCAGSTCHHRLSPPVGVVVIELQQDWVHVLLLAIGRSGDQLACRSETTCFRRRAVSSTRVRAEMSTRCAH